MGIIFLLLSVGLLVGSITAAIAMQRRAADRRSQLSNERIEDLAASYKKLIH